MAFTSIAAPTREAMDNIEFYVDPRSQGLLTAKTPSRPRKKCVSSLQGKCREPCTVPATQVAQRLPFEVVKQYAQPKDLSSEIFELKAHFSSLPSDHSRELSPTPLDLQDATLEQCATNEMELRDVPNDADENAPLNFQQTASQQDVPGGGDVLLHGSDDYDSDESINERPRVPRFRAARQRWSAIECDDLGSTPKQSFLSSNHCPPCRSISPGRYSPCRSVSPDPLLHGDYDRKPRHEASQNRHYAQYTKRPVVRTNYKPTPGCVRVEKSRKGLHHMQSKQTLRLLPLSKSSPTRLPRGPCQIECYTFTQNVGSRVIITIELPSLETGAATQPTSDRKPQTSHRRRYSREDDDLLLKLRRQNKPRLIWEEIRKHFPGRSQGSLQVRYCTYVAPRIRAENTAESERVR